MAEIDIKRVNFFDGQFLKELEFREEQKYHLHMRRRLNYILFNQSGVVRVNADDLKVEVASGKGIKINAGMAISRDTGAMEGKEIILKQDVNKNLTTEGIAAGQTAYVTIHYNEELAKDPPSEGDEDQDTRVKENVVITVHTSDPTTGTAANGEKYILLGTIAYDAMTVTDKRPIAGLNPYIGGVMPGPALPVIDSINVGSVIPNSTVLMIINGQNLSANPVVTILDNGGTADAEITATITTATAAQLTVQLVTAGAALGGRKVRVATDEGTVTTGPNAFNVAAAAAALVSIAITPALPTLHVGETQTFTATGTFSDASTRALNNAVDGLLWSSTAPAILSIDLTTGAANSLAVGMVTVRAQVGAITDQITFQVLAAATPPMIAFLSPDRQISGGTIDVSGDNLRNSLIAPPNPAAGTTLRFFKGANSKNGTNVIARPDAAGRQVVRVTVPDRSATPWGNKETVTLELTFNGLTAQSPFKYDD